MCLGGGLDRSEVEVDAARLQDRAENEVEWSRGNDSKRRMLSSK